MSPYCPGSLYVDHAGPLWPASASLVQGFHAWQEIQFFYFTVFGNCDWVNNYCSMLPDPISVLAAPKQMHVSVHLPLLPHAHLLNICMSVRVPDQ